MSVFADPYQSGLQGRIWVLRAGAELPDGLDYVAKGNDVVLRSPHPPTHHTIYPAEKMEADRFINEVLSLPWEDTQQRIKQ